MNVQLISWGVIGLGALVILIIYYRKRFREKFLKNLYLESADFKSLPEAGPDSCFIGKIAGSRFAAFIEPNQLQTHLLIGGSVGSGKTVAAQILVEEVLRSNISVLVFDPTAKWTGFMRENKDQNMFNLYPLFEMNKESAQAFNGNIYIIDDPMWEIDIEKHCYPGEISVFCLHKLDLDEMNTFIENTIQKIFRANLEESAKLRFLLVYEDIHQLLPQFGGNGRGLVQIGRAMREFRKYGIGIILISRILSALSEEIRANVSTEIQMRTTKNEDLKAVELKYGELIALGVAESPVGIGLIQNAQYNKGEPYFVNFRPLLHDPQRLDDEELNRYAFYNSKMDELEEGINVFKRRNIDTFDMELELDLARSGIRKRNFTILDPYIDSLKSRIKDYGEKLRKDRISEEERAILSKWESRKEEELKSYENELTELLEKRREELSKEEELLIQREREERMKIKQRMKKVEEEERQVMQELRDIEMRLEHKSRVLSLLKKYQQQVRILNKEVMDREKEKLEVDKERIRRKKMQQREKILQERERIIKEEREELGDIEYKKTLLEEEAENIQKRLSSIRRDKELILKMDRRIREREKELVEKIKDRIQSEIKMRKELLDKKLKEEEEKIAKLEKKQIELNQELKRKIAEREKFSREKRRKLVKEKDKLYYNLQKMKEIWKAIITNEKCIREMKGELRQKEERAESRGGVSSISAERDKIEKRLDQLREGREKLEHQLEKIRQEMKMEREC